MRRWIGFILHLAMIVILTSFGSYTLVKETSQNVPESLSVVNGTEHSVALEFASEPSTPIISPPFLGNSYIGFKEVLAFKESQGRYDVVNTLGYMGKYQFGLGTLNLMGVYSAQAFLNSPILQEKTFDTNIARNKWILRRDIKRFVGKRIRGVEITESGILAAAHLAGAGNVKKYLRSYGKNDVSDAYGSSISHYIKKFAGFDTSTIKQKRNAKV
ncbi:hypothetical protein [Flagellimonas nanhaiensis]|uniref:Peptidoglycan-binding protein LysM n=1 Tax=Flagellimonas nanhaiensis TaxID=2292706 RepID=A0A371JW52_9FLAO|nr:hypothetical protein [Allomuricauda nanhaiensis]RDY62026.1 hypothetical protein DX873_03815 [Allomuricauda nanhaiensis]